MKTTKDLKSDILEEIAQTELSIPTLEVRRRDELDYHECSVEKIRRALEAAFEAGQTFEAGQND